MTGLVALHVVNTMPAGSVHGRYDQSRMVLGQLRGLGIDYDEVVQAFEDDGVASSTPAGTNSASDWPDHAASGR